MPRPAALVIALALVAFPVQAQSEGGSAPPPSAPTASASEARARPQAGEVPPLPVWEVWPHGRHFGDGAERPADGAQRLCSFEAPVCVQGRASEGAAALEVLREAEKATRFLRLQARLPRPQGDAGAGGSDAVDLYLTDPPTDPAGPGLRLGFGLPTRFPVDRGPVHALLDRRMRGCERAVAVHEAMATAYLAGVDAGEAGATFAASSSYLAMLSSGCTVGALARLDEAQAHPERSLLDPGDADTSRASPLLPWWLDEFFGGETPGALLTGLWYGGQQSTWPGDSRFRNKPDLMTMLYRLAKARQQKADQWLLDLAVTRAFLGERDDGGHLAESAWLGAAGRVRFDAAWAHHELPRRLAYRPLDPTGMVYLWLDLRGPSPPSSLGVHFTWEYPVTMRWALVRLDAEGRELSRLVVAHQRGQTKADTIVEQLSGAASILVVGVNVGEVDLDEPFHIDETPYEPHAGTIHVYVPS